MCIRDRSIILFYRGVFNSEELNPKSSEEKVAAPVVDSSEVVDTDIESKIESTENASKIIDPENGVDPTE